MCIRDSNMIAYYGENEEGLVKLTFKSSGLPGKNDAYIYDLKKLDKIPNNCEDCYSLNPMELRLICSKKDCESINMEIIKLDSTTYKISPTSCNYTYSLFSLDPSKVCSTKILA